MTEFGELVDDSFDPTREYIYDAFVTYYENPTFTKIKEVKNYSLYVCKMMCMLSTHHRYVMVFVPIDNKPLGYEEKMKDLYWEFLHTRTLTDNHNIQPQTYKPRRFPPFMKHIELEHKDINGYEYKVQDLPLKVYLLPKEKGKDPGYQSKAMFVIALEEYQTIISWK